MAIKREMSVTLKFKSGATADLTGIEAQQALQSYKRRVVGGIHSALTFINGDGKQEFVEFECLCGMVVNDTTETTVPDVPCEQVNCIADYPPNP